MVKSAKAPVVAWLACAVALVLLVLAAYKIGSVQRLDATLLSNLTVREDSSIEWLANMVAHLADPVPLLVMLAGVCALGLHWGRPRHVVAAVIVVAGANLTTQILKVMLAHPRFQPILGANQVASIAFPSGHATAATSIAIAFAFVVPWRWQPAAAVLGVAYTLAVAASVLLLAWHYPSDVLGGILVAAGWGFAALAGLRLTRQRSGSPSPRQSASRAAISLK